MNRFKRKMLYGAIGLLSGLLAWALSAITLEFADLFPSFLSFSLIAGLLIGGSMGAYFGSLEGITQSVPQKIASGIKMGIVIGGLGGILGFVLGQAFLLYLGDYFLHSTKDLKELGIPLSKVIGWVVLGASLGAIEGLRTLSIQKIKVGKIGGALGGLLGGLALEFLPSLLPALVFVDLLGLCTLGLVIGLSFGFIEEQFSTAVLRILNGPFAGKEYLLVAKNSMIGLATKAEICLKGYQRIAQMEAKTEIIKGQVFLKALAKDAKIKVNDKPLGSAPLSPDDIIQLGNAKFIFYYR